MSIIKIRYQFDPQTPWAKQISDAVRGVEGTEAIHQHFCLSPCDGQVSATEQGMEFTLQGTPYALRRWIERLEELTGLEAPDKIQPPKPHNRTKH